MLIAALFCYVYCGRTRWKSLPTHLQVVAAWEAGSVNSSEGIGGYKFFIDNIRRLPCTEKHIVRVIAHIKSVVSMRRPWLIDRANPSASPSVTIKSIKLKWLSIILLQGLHCLLQDAYSTIWMHESSCMSPPKNNRAPTTDLIRRLPSVQGSWLYHHGYVKTVEDRQLPNHCCPLFRSSCVTLQKIDSRGSG
jgi:hypothetical protein